jgi:hypothetical protein
MPWMKSLYKQKILTQILTEPGMILITNHIHQLLRKITSQYCNTRNNIAFYKPTEENSEQGHGPLTTGHPPVETEFWSHTTTPEQNLDVDSAMRRNQVNSLGFSSHKESLVKGKVGEVIGSLLSWIIWL